MEKEIKRCAWSDTNDLMRKYHDEEWGFPLHDDRKLFEFMVLDAFQAGLSWQTIINKRENFRKAFDGFDPNDRPLQSFCMSIIVDCWDIVRLVLKKF